MQKIPISEFRANMNGVLQKVQRGEIVSLTAHGVEIAQLVPPDFVQIAAQQELARLRTTAVVGDVISPVAVVM